MYRRVIPRDLFNESKILKCYGRLVLESSNHRFMEVFDLNYEGNEFKIDQHPESGDFSISNIQLTSKDGQYVYLFSKLNSKDAYPLWFYFESLEENVNDHEGLVFDDNGNTSVDFDILMSFLKGRIGSC